MDQLFYWWHSILARVYFHHFAMELLANSSMIHLWKMKKLAGHLLLESAPCSFPTVGSLAYFCCHTVKTVLSLKFLRTFLSEAHFDIFWDRETLSSFSFVYNYCLYSIAIYMLQNLQKCERTWCMVLIAWLAEMAYSILVHDAFIMFIKVHTPQRLFPCKNDNFIRPLV